MKNSEEFLREICPNHTDNSKWNKSELLTILDKYQASQLQQNDVIRSNIYKNEIYFRIADANHPMYHPNRFKSEEEARETINKEYTNRCKNDGYDDYWRNRKQILIRINEEVLG